MSSSNRVFAVLSLFSEEHPVWHADEINEELGYARATGYRCVKDLVEGGFLQKVSAGRYALGARIIELDYLLRRSDPVLLAAAPVMDELVRKSRLDSVLTAMFGMKVVDTYRASGDAALDLGYGRGRPRPLFLGAAPKVILAHLPRLQMLRLYEAHAGPIAARGLGASWQEFRARMAEIRKSDFYWSHGELEADVGGAAVPLLNADNEAVGAVALVGKNEDLEAMGEKRLRAMLKRAREDIHARLSRA